jgi:hypothetical protein
MGVNRLPSCASMQDAMGKVREAITFTVDRIADHPKKPNPAIRVGMHIELHTPL